MQIEITKSIKVREVVEIDLPFYYRHDLQSDHENHVIYGKVEKDKWTTIAIRLDCDGGVAFELEIEAKNPSGLGCYLADEYKSSEAEYASAKEKFLAAAQGA